MKVRMALNENKDILPLLKEFELRFLGYIFCFLLDKKIIILYFNRVIICQ